MSFSQLDLTNADDGTCGEFRAKLFRAKTLFTFIKAVHFRDDGNVFISPNGIKVTVEDSKCFQGNAFVQRNLFNVFSLLPEDETSNFSFQLQLPLILESLNIFQKTGQLQLHYSTRSNELCLHIEDQGTVSEAVIRTQDSEETLDFSFGRDEVIFKVILNAEKFKDIFNEIDSTSDFIYFYTDESLLQIRTKGSGGKVIIDIPSDSEMVSSFMARRPTTARYRHSLLKHAFKPIGMSEKVSIRIDERCFICFQFIVKVESEVSFLEFYCAPEEDEDD
ncbi:cell cycle checkpoint protein RAD1 [Lepeophtheirus salmonis]|uniref:cell cycle checkpoint protein RAD1 n=1 Tax=Lepeophtheirus salmonis TaxID=72036 RepID=UPI001AE8BE0A|nr:cell cycle checkpoint protein RAD1-like [Lepeophtheirus salmonis]